jgi:hypothetical protein
MAIQDFMPRVGYGLDQVPTGAKNADDLLALLPNPDASSIFYIPYDVDGSIAKAAFERGWPVERIFVHCPEDCIRTVRSNVRRFKGCETQVIPWPKNFVFSIKRLRVAMDKIFEHLRDPKFVIGFNPDWRFYKQFIEAYMPRAEHMAWICPDGWLNRESDKEFRRKIVPGISTIIHNSRTADRFRDVYKQDGCTIVAWTTRHNGSEAAIYQLDGASPVKRYLTAELDDRDCILPDLGPTIDLITKIQDKIGLRQLEVQTRACNLTSEEAKASVVPAEHAKAQAYYTHGWQGYIDGEKFFCDDSVRQKYNVVFLSPARQPQKNGKTKLFDKMQILRANTGFPDIYLSLPAASLLEAQSLRSICQRTITRWLATLVGAGRYITPANFSRFPALSTTRCWGSDQELYELCELTQVEIAMIESKILSWPANDGTSDGAV